VDAPHPTPPPARIGGQDAWLQRLSETLVGLIRFGRNPRWHEHVGTVAGVPLAPHLYLVLIRIAEYQPVRVSQLVDELGIHNSQVSRNVQELVDQGYVRRTTDPTDQRAAQLELTDEGRASVAAVWQAWRDTLADVTATWPTEERERFIELFERFAADLDRRQPR
jgi:DNA-binding MarR family transcriptional regulator